jgi:hypothetical protein
MFFFMVVALWVRDATRYVLRWRGAAKQLLFFGQAFELQDFEAGFTPAAASMAAVARATESRTGSRSSLA